MAMLRKLAAALNPFSKPQRQPAAVTAEASNIGGPTHAFEHYCECATCRARLDELTAQRLRQQRS